MADNTDVPRPLNPLPPKPAAAPAPRWPRLVSLALIVLFGVCCAILAYGSLYTALVLLAFAQASGGPSIITILTILLITGWPLLIALAAEGAGIYAHYVRKRYDLSIIIVGTLFFIALGLYASGVAANPLLR